VPESKDEAAKIAAETIAMDLERLKRQADANGLALLAYLIELAQAEAHEMKR
jgi:ABC-type transporter Mla MlaB component